MADDYARRLKALVDTATDKDAVKKSIDARLHANATMGVAKATSSKDAEIDAIVAEFEGDEDMSQEVMDAMKKMGGKRRRKTRKPTRKTRKTRKYSRRR
jgi:ABC-type proline/glycine betaine transport system substrate-binding protein